MTETATNVPVIPDSAPFTPEQKAWLNGYLAGLFSRGAAAVTAPAAEQKLTPLMVLYGSQTGTAESLAKQFAKLASARQFVTTVVDMASATAEMLCNAKNIIVVTSTYGEGEPPDNAVDFWKALSAESYPRLTGIPYSVFALGDTNYEKFCQFGADLDLRLEALGARRICDRFDADTDYEGGFAIWSAQTLAALAGESVGEVVSERPLVTEAPSPLTNYAELERYSKKNPFQATLKANRLLSLKGSEKETRHFEIGLDDTITYEPGDALGVWPRNNPARVAEIIAGTGFSPETEVEADGRMTFRQALTEKFDLKQVTLAAASPQDLINTLKKIQPRLYSISSSLKAHPNEVHLTVSVVRYKLNGVAHEGLCSTYLADRAAELALPVYVHKNSTFRLPQDSSRAIIMVGPGTGIAPFRAFLEERRITGATGKNLLFFGEQRSAYDFYYRDELQAMVNDSFLRLHTAFSRDQQQKFYVQDRMLENATEIFALLEEGAYFYICGDATRMAKDVDAALRRAIETAGGLGSDAALEYVQRLRTTKRYLRDVY